MSLNQQNKCIRFILRAIDLFVAFTGPSVHWDEDPFQKASLGKWRQGWLFVACLSIMMLVFSCNHSIKSFVEHAGDPGHSIVWLYAAFIGFASIGAFGLVKIGPRIPLFISLPTAIVALIYCIWLLGFHSERIAHS
ncbi:MAG TPA: hypothetical protein VKV04_24285 [Verrucomicrobiae bacterium]|nr:hypothetical protein [Verrucomicrobiae bacterium]